MLPLNALLPLFSNSDIASPKIKDAIQAPSFAKEPFSPPSLLPYLWFSANIYLLLTDIKILKLKTPPPIPSLWPLTTVYPPRP